MLTDIKQLADLLFEDVPFTKISEKNREQAETLLQKEYEKLLEQGKNEIQAMGSLMEQYGTYESVCKACEVDCPSVMKPAMSLKEFEHRNRKCRLATFWMAFWAAEMILTVMTGLIEHSLWQLLGIAVELLLGLIPVLKYKNACKVLAYDEISLSVEAKKKLFFYLDKHKKRMLNSVFLLSSGIVLYVSLTLERALVSQMTKEELKGLLLSNQIILLISFVWCIKNSLDVYFLLHMTTPRERTEFQKFVRKQYAFAGLCFLFMIGLTFLSSVKVKNPYIFLYVFNVLFVTIGFLITFQKRKPLVRVNLRINEPLIAVGLVVCLLVVTVHQFQRDVYVLEPYIMSVSEVPHVEHSITYDQSSGEYTICAGNEDFKILHLTDIHLGGSVTSSYKDYKALEACRKLIAYSKPDLVLITGDLVFPMGIMSYSFNNEAPVIQFAAFMRNIGIPWAFTYGNHDTEMMATGSRSEIDELYKTLSFKTSQTLLYPYQKPDITGRCNQLIKITNTDGSLRQAVFLIDSNDYIEAGINEYDYIHEDQVKWYQEQIVKLKTQQGGDVSSMIFFHIPLQEYKTALELYENGSQQVQYYFGEIGEKMINRVCCSDYPSDLFETAVALGSTKAMFCGHDHYNNISLEYKGIRLTYGMSIDYLAMPGIAQQTKQRGAEEIILKADSSFEVNQIPLVSIE